MEATLLKQALLGTEKSHHVDPAMEGRIEAIEALTELLATDSAPWKLLLKAGCYDLAEQAGFEPEMVLEPNVPPQWKESRLEISPQLTQCLTQFLKEFSDTPQVSIHVLKQIEKRKLHLPAASLPEFLNVFSQRRMFKEDAHETVLSLIGERGRWLAARNPDWKWASSPLLEEKNCDLPELESVWNEGAFRERESALKIIVEHDPAKAKRLLVETWKNEKAEHREAFLNVMESRLDDTDIPFLEEVLKDRSASIRQTVATLLAKRPESSYAQRTRERAEDILIPGPKPKTLQIKAPAEFTSSMKADALEEKPPRGVGKKAWWISESLRRVPLTHWEKRFQMKPHELLAALSQDDDYPSVLYAWTYAVQWFPNHDHWLEALWNAWSEIKPGSFPGALNLREVLMKYALGRFPLQFWEKLKKEKRGIEHYSWHLQSAWLELLQTKPQPWEKRFLAALFDYLRATVTILPFPVSFMPFFPKSERPRLRALIQHYEDMEKRSNYHSSANEKCKAVLDLCDELDRLLETPASRTLG